MSGTISNAKEIYHKLPRDTSGNSSLVPVRGVYVTGEYKPPIYTDPSLNLLSITTNKSTVEDWVERYVTTTDIKTTHHLYDVSVDSTFRIDNYTTANMTPQTDHTTHHLYDIYMDPTFNIESYTTEQLAPQIDKAGQHLYDFTIDSDFEISYKSAIIGGSQPESTLRIVELSTGAATIMNI